MWMNILFVFIGGAFGSVSRYLLSMAVTRATQGGIVFPFGTLSANLLGAFVAGILWGIGSETIIKPEMRLLLMTGFLGGFTTFSAFAVETYGLLNDGEWKEGLINMLANTVGTVLLVAAGVIVTKYFFNMLRGGVS
jgi:CrcB protein